MLREPIMFPRAYGAYLTLASLDVLLTSLILSLGGIELNTVAAWVIERGGHEGMTAFKFATVVVVLVTIEYISRHQEKTARSLTRWALIISAFPILVSVSELTTAVALGHSIIP